MQRERLIEPCDKKAYLNEASNWVDDTVDGPVVFDEDTVTQISKAPDNTTLLKNHRRYSLKQWG